MLAPQSPQHLPLPDIAAYLHAHLHDNPSPASVAAHFGLNRFALSRRFRAETGLCLREYIAALKIEQGIAPLLDGQPVIASQLEAGHASAATFSHRFQAHTGMCPRDYQQHAAQLAHTLAAAIAKPQARQWLHRPFAAEAHRQPHPLHVHISGGEATRLVFVGLYPAPIPRGAPALGAALLGQRHWCINAVPDGRYYLLACEIRASTRLMDYFRLDHCLRARLLEPLQFPLPAARHITLALRPHQASDPPITVNLPKLLFDALRRNP
ncbi:MAG: AraC family transcriptional regulator [Pseudomonadota bacterium]|nr:AraC family transcriptional regulator [Pseudomonadota bacterium]